MEELMIVANVAIVFGVIYKLFELYVRRQERIMLIEKLSSGWRPEEFKGNLLPQFSSSGNWALRGGCLMLGLGLGLLVGFILTLMFFESYIVSDEWSGKIQNSISVIYGSCLLLGGGLGLIVAYLVEMNRLRKEKGHE